MFAKLLGGLIVAVALAAPVSYATLAAEARTDGGVAVRAEKSPCCRPGFDCCKNIGQACCRRR